MKYFRRSGGGLVRLGDLVAALGREMLDCPQAQALRAASTSRRQRAMDGGRRRRERCAVARGVSRIIGGCEQIAAQMCEDSNEVAQSIG